MISKFRTRRPRRCGAAIAAVAAVVLVLGGCGGGSAANDSGGPVTLQWWSWNPDQGAAPQYIAAFEAAHPDIHVEHRFLQYTEYTNALRLAITSNTGPDVFGLQVGALAKAYAPLSADLTPYAAAEFGSGWADRLLETDQLQVDGKQVAMPWTVTAAGLLWYDKTLFDANRLTPPTTLAELQQVCARFHAQGIDCMVQGAKDAWANIDLFHTLLNQVQPGALKEAAAGRASFTDPPFVEAVTAFRQLFTSGIIQEGATGISEYPDAADRFRRGQAATIALGTWENNTMTRTVLERLAGELNTPAVAKKVFLPVPFPHVVGDHPAPGLFGGPDVGWAISQHSTHKDAAWTFVSWLTSHQEGQQLLADATLQTPALKGVTVASTDVATPVQQQALAEQPKLVQNLIAQRQLPSADLEQALGEALSAVAAGTQEPAAALAAVQGVAESEPR